MVSCADGRLWPKSITALLAIGVVFLACGPQSSLPAEDPAAGLALLARAVGEVGPVDARLSGPWRPGRCRPLRQTIEARLCPAPSTPFSAEQTTAARQLRGRIERRRSAETLHLRGVWKLCWAKTDEAAEQAISTLRSATHSEPEHARIHNDLGVAYLNRAYLKDNPQDLILALKSVREAVSLDPRSLEAAYNHALLLGKLYLWRASSSAWETYLALDSASEWALEARRSRDRAMAEVADGSNTDRQRLDRKAHEDRLSRDTTSARSAAIEDLLPAWAAAALENEPAEGSRLTRALRELSDRLEPYGNDRLLPETVAHLEGREADLSGADTEQLARGHRDLQRGIEALERYRLGEAKQALDRAADELRGSGVASGWWATYYRAVADYHENAYDAALQRLDSILEQTRGRGFLDLEAHALKLGGLIQGIRADHSMAVGSLTRAVALFDRLNAVTAAAASRAQLAELYLRLGRTDLVWSVLHPALRTLSASEVTSRFKVHTVASAAATAMGFPSVGLGFQDEVARSAELWGNPFATIGALRDRALLRHAAGEDQAALQDLRTALIVASSSAPSVREVINADSILLRAELTPEPSAALILYRQAVDAYRRTDLSSGLPRVFLGQARRLRELGRSKEAVESLEAGIRELEGQRETIGSAAERIAFLASQSSLFDELADLWLSRGDADEALYASERSRARALLDALDRHSPQPDGPGSGPLAVETLQGYVTPDTVIVEFLVLPSHLSVWLIRDDRSDQVRIDIGADRLNGLVEAFVSQLESRAAAEELRASSSAIARVLLPPILSRLAGETHLVFVPDKWLHRLPFSALWLENGFLVEAFQISVAPSASHWAHASVEARARERLANAPALVVGNASPGPLELPGVPGAEAEARSIARLYPGATLLAGAEATKRRVLARMGSSSVAHIAAHALANETEPMMSQIFLAPEAQTPGDGGILFASELLPLRFDDTSLVVLAGCDTARGPMLPGEGPASFAYAFLAAGVPAVAATLWILPDDAAEALFVRFHRELSRGESAAAALRTAQIAMIRAEGSDLSHPSSWGAVQLIGASRPSRARE